MKFLRSIKGSIHWTKTGTLLLSGFLLVIFLIGYIWWNLLEEYLSYIDPEYPIWKQLDLLLIGNFLVMSILILINADLRRDILYILVGLAGGYIIEAWGTRSGLWTYYTSETPPLWIIPAWPIAALSVNRLYGIIERTTGKHQAAWLNWVYWLVFVTFYGLLLRFAYPAILHPLTIFSLLVCAVVILANKDKFSALLIFIIGSALGYFLERWGTSRLCWAYYTGGSPPFFTVLAHGMASVAIWRVYVQACQLLGRIKAGSLRKIDSTDMN